MNAEAIDRLNPWPALLAITLELESDEVVSLIDRTGLTVDWEVSHKDSYTNSTRKRAYRPRIDMSFQLLDEDTRLRVAWILTSELLQRHPEKEDEVRLKFAELGWRVDAGKLVPSTSTIRELLLTGGSEYDSYRHIKKIMQESKKSITVIDPYLNATIFTMLSASGTTELSVKLLTAKPPADFVLEGSKFQKQYPKIEIEIRITSNFHDRFMIIDDCRCWHIGASIKDAGNKIFVISQLEDETNRDALARAFAQSWSKGKLVNLA